MTKKYTIIALLGIWIISLATNTLARDKIRIVGSAVVSPFFQTVSENFSINFGYTPPSIEITGTGQGFRLFCSGVGYQHPDINVTPRPISAAELAYCYQNGIESVVEIVVGLDALAMVNNKASSQIRLTTTQLFNALALKIEQNGRLVDNPHQNWSDVNPKLPDDRIQVMGPAPTSSYYDAFSELLMRKGCTKFPSISNLSDREHYKICRHPRRDGIFVSGMNNNIAMLNWLKKNPKAFAFVPINLLEQYPDYIQANLINGSAPDQDAVSSGRYPLVRPIYLYVKKRHVSAVPGIQQFLYEVTAERTIGPEGYLGNNGFKCLNELERNKARDFALSLSPLKR
jgi:phosphate transport system substrate-binding protein